MGNHYIPQFYLRGFAAGNTIWAHDRIECRSFATQPKSIANETSMYPDWLEKYLTNEVEEPAKPGIMRIRSEEPVTDEDRIAIARYLVTLWKRVPQGRANVHGRLPGVAGSVRNEIFGRLSQGAELNPDLKEVAEPRKRHRE